jgi:transposase
MTPVLWSITGRIRHLCQHLVPPAKPGGRPEKSPKREILEAIFSILRGSCAWRLLPHDFPPWQIVYQ